ncbi:30S ribosomal protein S17 [Fibrobacterota bacterium]
MAEEALQKKPVKRSSKRKVRSGVVFNDKMDKSITIVIKKKKSDPLYGKTTAFSKKLTAHDEKNEARKGDFVEVMETRPLSKSKRWRLINILTRKK